MAPPHKVEMAFMHFTFNEGSLSHGSVKITRRHNKSKLSDFVALRYDWAKAALNSELVKLQRVPEIKFSEWGFHTCDPEIFKILDKRFDHVFILLGEDLVHWSFFNNGDGDVCIEGEADLPLTYCTCCLQDHYEKVVADIKKWITEHSS